MATLPERLVLVLIGLYPRSWRMRYEVEFRALVSETPVTWREAADVACAVLPEWARVVRGSLVGSATGAGELAPVGRLLMMAVLAWSLASVAHLGLSVRADYYSSTWSRTAHMSPHAIDIATKAARREFSWMLSPDGHEVALSYKYAPGMTPSEYILVRPCCSLRWAWNTEMRRLNRQLEDFAVLGWYALVGCVPIILLFRLTSFGRAYPRVGRLLFLLVFIKISSDWSGIFTGGPWLSYGISVSRSLSFALEGAILARALLPLAERPSVARSPELVTA